MASTDPTPNLPQAGSPALRRFIRGTDGGIVHEIYDEKEGQLRFSASLSHAALVKLLLEKGGEYTFSMGVEEFADLCRYQVRILVEDGVCKLALIHVPEDDPGEDQGGREPEPTVQ